MGICVTEDYFRKLCAVHWYNYGHTTQANKQNIWCGAQQANNIYHLNFPLTSRMIMKMYILKSEDRQEVNSYSYNFNQEEVVDRYIFIYY